MSQLLSVKEIIKDFDFSKPGKVLVKDAKGAIYTVWQNLSNSQSPTKAFESLQGIKEGDLAEIVYKEDEQGRLTAVKFKPLVNAPVQTNPPYAPRPIIPRGAPISPQPKDNFGTRLALHGMVNGMLASGCTPNDIPLDDLVSLEERINQVLSNHVFSEDIQIEHV